MLKMLIVDDNLEFIQNLFNYIKNENQDEYIVTNICKNGEEAYKYLINNTPDLILLDLNMPKMNGSELLLKLKGNKSSSKIIIITGEPNLLPQILKLNIEIENVLIKPFNYDKLFDILKKLNKENNTINLDNLIKENMNNFCFNKSSPGYLYIVQGIKECVYNKKYCLL